MATAGQRWSGQKNWPLTLKFDCRWLEREYERAKDFRLFKRFSSDVGFDEQFITIDHDKSSREREIL